MNKHLLFISFLLVINLDSQIIDHRLEMYQSALKYLQNTSIVLDKFNSNPGKDLDTVIYYVSSEILSFDPSNFSDEILDYEFSNCDDSTKRRIQSYLEGYVRVKFKDENRLERLNQDENFNVIIFFSNIHEGHLIAEPTYMTVIIQLNIIIIQALSRVRFYI